MTILNISSDNLLLAGKNKGPLLLSAIVDFPTRVLHRRIMSLSKNRLNWFMYSGVFVLFLPDSELKEYFISVENDSCRTDNINMFLPFEFPRHLNLRYDLFQYLFQRLVVVVELHKINCQHTTD